MSLRCLRFNVAKNSSGAWIPIIGNGSVMFKPHGFRKPEKNIAELKEKLLPPGATMMRAKFPILNPGRFQISRLNKRT